MAVWGELRAAVLEGLRNGKSVETLTREITMEKYAHWGSYEQWRALNIEGMARHLRDPGAAN